MDACFIVGVQFCRVFSPSSRHFRTSLYHTTNFAQLSPSLTCSPDHPTLKILLPSLVQVNGSPPPCHGTNGSVKSLDGIKSFILSISEKKKRKIKQRFCHREQKPNGKEAFWRKNDSSVGRWSLFRPS